MNRLIFTMAMLIFAVDACAATVGPISVVATVQASSSLSCTIVSCTAPGGVENCGTTAQPSMDFGNLTNAVPGDVGSALTSPKFFKVFCGINTSGTPYSVAQTGTSLINSQDGVTKLTDNAWVFTPIAFVDTTDPDNIANEPLPPGVTVGSKVSVNSTSAKWIDTGSATNVAVIQAVYSITGDPTLAVSPTGDLVPPNQKAGIYTAQVTWTMTPK